MPTHSYVFSLHTQIKQSKWALTSLWVCLGIKEVTPAALLQKHNAEEAEVLYVFFFSFLTAIECIRKCLFVKLITNLKTVPVSNYSVWVTFISISTFSCSFTQCQPHGTVNLYIDLPVCFPFSLPFFLEMNCHIPSTEHQSTLRNLPQS